MISGRLLSVTVLLICYIKLTTGNWWICTQMINGGFSDVFLLEVIF